MPVRDILRMGNPRLRLKASAVDRFGDNQLASMINDMLDTMKAFDGAGLAAPQIGVPLRVVIFGIDKNPRLSRGPACSADDPDQSRNLTRWESDEFGLGGCLSVPGMRGLVPRYTHIRYHGLDADGREIEREVEGFHARVIQHECDHLDGILYPDRIEDRESFGFIEELQAAGRIGVDVPHERRLQTPRSISAHPRS